MGRVYLPLIRNPKAYGSKGFFVEIKPNGELNFQRAVVPKFHKGLLIGGEFEIEEGKVYIHREDRSSHKHSRQVYALYVAKEELEKVAEIIIEDRNLGFYPEELKEVYVEVKKTGKNNVVVNTLIEYAKRQGLLGAEEDEKKKKAKELKQLLEKAREIARKLELHNLESVLSDIIQTINP